MFTLIRILFVFVILAVFMPTEPLSALEVGSDNPAIISATVIEHKTDTDVFVADGNVVIEQGKMRLSTDHAELDNKTGQVKGRGSVTYTDKDGNTIFTDKVDFNINTQKGILYNGRFYIKSNKPAAPATTVVISKDQWKDFEEMRLTGNEIEKTGEDTYTIDRGTFTTCTADTPAWKLSGTDLHVTLDDAVTARNATFYLRDVPVLYFPYVKYPLERRTGFLIPLFGIGSREGFKMYNRFFWAISDSQDATFGLDYRALEGVELGLDYRYVLGADSRGELKHRYFRGWENDKDKGDEQDSDRSMNRYSLDYNLIHRFTPTLTGKADFHYLKENNYYRDYSDQTEQRIQRYTESNVFLTQSWERSTLVGLIQYQDNLTEGNNSSTLQRLPEVRYTMNRTRIGESPWFYYFDASATRFYRREGMDGSRLDLYPRMIGDYDLGYGFILSPRVGFRETMYNRKWDRQAGSARNEATTREVPEAGVSLNVKLAKVYQANGFWGMDAIRHQVEPGLDYSHVPYIHHQRKIPQFDAVDSIGERDHLTWSLTNRLIGKYSVGEQTVKQELMVFTLSQSFNVEEAKRRERGVNRRPFGTIAGDLSVWLNNYVNLRHKATYDPDAGNMSHYDTDLSMNPNSPWFFIVGHRYTRQSAINFIKASAGYRFNKNWAVAGNIWYDQEKSKVREQDFTLSYSGQCWGISLHYIEKAGEDAPDMVRKRETQYLFTIDFKGLTSLEF
ncbi:MAG: LPS assembly protein LptD [Nitrospirota bacterium]|nr:LPS assembly protein LptD [Nitrospirota bacterium]